MSSSLFGSGSDCGPSNPLQSLGKHESGVNTSQNERFVQGSSAESQFRSTSSPNHALNDEFRAFAQSTRESDFRFVEPPMQQHQMYQQPSIPQPVHLNNTVQSDWAAQFSKLSVNGNVEQVVPVVAPVAAHPVAVNMSSGYQSTFPSTMRPDLSVYQTTTPIAQQSEHQQTHSLQQEQTSFENAFDQVAKSLEEKESEKEMPVEQQDLSDLAQTIVNSVKETSKTTNNTTSQKMKNSNFMALMGQLSNRNVLLEGTKFVDGTGTEVKLDALQRHEQSKPQLTDEKASTPEQLPALGDPFAYFESQGKSLDPHMLSPFELAQSIAPLGVVERRDWEEAYDEDELWAQ
jgi:hypothetical protein